jgi:lysophospholipase L1-like esterase
MSEEESYRDRLQLWRLLALLVGGATIAEGLLADWTGLSRPGSFGGDQILLVSAGLVVSLVGFLFGVNDVRNLRSFGQRIAVLYRGAAILVLNTLVLLGCLELGAMFLLTAESLLSGIAEPRTIDPRAELPYYASQDWAAEFWREFSDAEQRNYHSWVIWRRAPFEGATININEQGIRRTPGPDCGANSYRLFTFGGSAMWGEGAPDWGTIAAYLQAGLRVVAGDAVCVVNFGESGYVSTHSLMELLMQLQQEKVPDVVVFYDGIGDVYAAYQSGEAGVHMNPSQIAAKLTEPQNRFIEWLKGSQSFVLLQRAAARLGPGEQPVTYQTLGIDTESLADSVAQIYLGNYEIVGALAQEYGFEYLFFWQPVISVGEKQLTVEEQEMRASMDPALVNLVAAVYRKIELAAPQYENLYYIAQPWEEQRAQVWIDWAHVTPVGNQLIAEEMLDALDSQLAGE